MQTDLIFFIREFEKHFVKDNWGYYRRLPDGKIIDIRELPQPYTFYIDKKGVKHIVQLNKNWQPLKCKWNDELVFDENLGKWRVKTKEEILGEKKQKRIEELNSKTQQYIDSTFPKLDWGENEADALTSIQNTIDINLGQILYLLEEDLKTQNKDTSKITVSTFWKRTALYLAGKYSSDQAVKELKSLGVTDETIQKVIPLLEETIQAAALKLWDEEVWRYEENLEEAIQNAKSIEEIDQILQNIQFPPPPGGNEK